jgi:hypothetical protein
LDLIEIKNIWQKIVLVWHVFNLWCSVVFCRSLFVLLSFFFWLSFWLPLWYLIKHFLHSKWIVILWLGIARKPCYKTISHYNNNNMCMTLRFLHFIIIESLAIMKDLFICNISSLTFNLLSLIKSFLKHIRYIYLYWVCT